MENRKVKKSVMPKFKSERDEAKWWASTAGRTFLKGQSAVRSPKGSEGSKLVSMLAGTTSVQIALRLPALDLAKAREIAARKGIGYQTLLKMLVHEGLQRAESYAER